MPDINFTILYVENPRVSAAFYSRLLGCPPVEASDNFAMLPLRSGTMLGLWGRHDVKPEVTPAGGVELGFQVEDVDAVCAEWTAQGLQIVQAPVAMEFGYTFVALDPDGHRLRVLRDAS